MAKIKKPTVKNPELVSAMAEFKANATPENEKAMTDAIKNAQFIAPVIMEDLPDKI